MMMVVVTDLFTKFVQMYATKKQGSIAAAKKLFDEYVLTYGFPERIMHDKGGHFNSDLFAELHRLSGIKASNTTPYHPMSNGQCERMNRSLVSMLRSLSPAEKRDWKSVLPKLSFAYNSTQHASTGFTPFFMMFGRESRLPIDEVFDEVQMEDRGKLRRRSHQEFVEQWRESMQEVFRLAKENNEKVQAYNKGKYDGKVREIGIEEGDHVLVRNLRERGGTGKLRSHWEHHIFKVVSQQGDLPVYKVRNKDKPRDVRVLHRNHLLKCDELPTDVFKEAELKEVPKTQVKPKKKSTATAKVNKDQQQDQRLDREPIQVDSDDEEGEYQIVIYPDDEGDREVPGGGAGQMGAEEQMLVNSEVTPELVEDSADEIDVHEREEQDEGDDEEEDEDEETPLRRSSRVKTSRKVFTFTNLGGNPSYSGVT